MVIVPYEQDQVIDILSSTVRLALKGLTQIRLDRGVVFGNGLHATPRERHNFRIIQEWDYKMTWYTLLAEKR